MTRLRILMSVLLLAAFVIACKKNAASHPENTNKNLRVLGYLMSYTGGNWHEDVDVVDFSRITDLNLAFINPNETGGFPAGETLKKAVDKAHAKNVRVFCSIGGGSPPAHLEGLLEDNRRAALVAGLVQLTETAGFDGIDVDLENDLINQHYAKFISELAAALKPRKKLLTAALAAWNAKKIDDVTLQQFDLINIMSYDQTGPWAPTRPGQHAPLAMAESDFRHFNQARRIPAERLLIGLPFYGRCFGPGAPEAMHYKDIVANFAGAQNNDEVTMSTGAKIYYNGLPTITQKVNFAKNNKAGGVMIWELRQDSGGEHSLLRKIAGLARE